MSYIYIKDQKIHCCHGVKEIEKTVPQNFLVSAKIFTDIDTAARTDDIFDTVSYSDVMKVVVNFMQGNCFNLLETIATRLAKTLLIGFETVRRVELEIKKPEAPVSQCVECVSVAVEKEWTECYLSLGSNLGFREVRLKNAVAKLKANKSIRVLAYSLERDTAPIGLTNQPIFLNSVVKIETFLSPAELLEYTQKIEDTEGRVRTVKYGPRTLDIDILMYGDKVLNLPNLIVPHPEMINREFVLEPMCDLAPYLIHPVTRLSMKQMLDKVRG